uniref:Variant surface glycoprotein VSG 10.1 n=1 Tax=Trypanosoma brucei TaxID=5691 RepID=Q9BJD8_9TRYP|nr:variant surface glycoprotein VSG 10.1 [Trypanosoma brucei]
MGQPKIKVDLRYILALLVTVQASPAADLHDTKLKIENECDAAEHLTLMLTKIHSTLDNQEQQLRTARQYLWQTVAAVATEAANGNPKYIPILAAQTQLLAAAEKKTANFAKPLRATAAGLAQLIGAQTSLAEITDLKLSAQTPAAAAAFFTATTKAIPAQALNNAKPKCKAKYENKPRDAATTPRNYAETTTVKFYHLEALTADNGELKTPKLCAKAGSAPAADCSDGEIGASAQLAVAGGNLLKTTAVEYSSKNAEKGQFKATTNNNALAPPKDFVQAALEGLHQAPEQLSNLNFRAESLRAGSITEEQAFKKAVALAYIPGADLSKLHELNDKISAVIKSEYTDDSGSLTAKIWEPLGRVTLNKAETATDTTQTLKDDVQIEALGTAVAYRLIAAVQAKATSSGKKTEEDLSKKADSADKTGESRKQGDNKTTTNTTGSNSFVINKAPLLLALLLS